MLFEYLSLYKKLRIVAVIFELVILKVLNKCHGFLTNHPQENYYEIFTNNFDFAPLNGKGFLYYYCLGRG